MRLDNRFEVHFAVAQHPRDKSSRWTVEHNEPLTEPDDRVEDIVEQLSGVSMHKRKKYERRSRCL